MTRMADPSTALLLIAHGSREPAANADLHRLADELRGTGRYATVVAAFLELAEPDIDAGGAACAASGAARVVLVPYFLSAGVHVRRDLAEARERLAGRFPGVEVRLAEPLGPHALLTEIVVQRVASAVSISKAAPRCSDAGQPRREESAAPPQSRPASP
jgi:sirohydrochlorin ferrochelatase